MPKPGKKKPNQRDLTSEEELIVKNLRAFRLELDYSHQELAQEAQLSVDTVRSYEYRRRVPDRDSLARLARAFGRTIDDFYQTDPPPPRIDVRERTKEFTVADGAGRMVAVRVTGASPALVEVLRRAIAEFDAPAPPRRATPALDAASEATRTSPVRRPEEELSPAEREAMRRRVRETDEGEAPQPPGERPRRSH